MSKMNANHRAEPLAGAGQQGQPLAHFQNAERKIRTGIFSFSMGFTSDAARKRSGLPGMF